jgi:WhiB family redox-sensing transcriptional regulator
VTDWRQYAACRGTDPATFFPERGDTEGLQRALAICATCLVTEACNSYALAIGEDDGVWGGRSGQQRRRERRSLLVRDRVIVCRQCGIEFMGTHQARLCSDECRAISDRAARRRRSVA